MPYTSKQHRLFEAAARSPAVAKRTGIKRSDAVRMAHEGVKKTRTKKLMAHALRGSY